LGDAFEVDVESLPVRKAGEDGPRILETPIEVEPPAAETANPERAEAGVEPARWQLYATFENAPPGSWPMNADKPDLGSRADTEAEEIISGAIVVGFPETGRVYRVERPEFDLQKLRAFYLERGRNQPVAGEKQAIDISAVEESTMRKAWFSDDEDNRVPRGIWEYSATTWPYNTISQAKPNGTGPDEVIDGYCTATFLGSQSQRHVITAAHCFWDNVGNYVDLDYVPRKDGCLAGPPYQGWPFVPCDNSPYGQWDGWVWMMPQAFLDNCVGLGDLSDPRSAYFENENTCRSNDIAIQQAGPESGATFPGAMGFGAYSSGQLNNDFYVYERGYPTCGGPVERRPVNCRVDTLYGDSLPCSFASFSGRRFYHSCDSSGGQSGSPFYLYDGGVYAAGVHTGLNPGNPVATPFTGARIDGQFYGWMLDFMNL